MHPRRLPTVSFPPELPVSQRADEIIAAIRRHPVLIIAGETGSGKTTQLPKMLLAAGYGRRGRIACTQPRRVAALSVSRRIAEELKVQWGREVGAKIRFTDQTSDQTIIKMLTDGMLLSEIQGDPDLRQYEAIILDEAHERSLNIDFLLGYLNQLRARRPELRILVTSATIDTATFAKAFDDAPIIEVSGRTWPVHIEYAPIPELLGDSEDFTYIEAAAQALEDVITRNRPGDVLIFLPGEKDIRDLRELLQGRLGGGVELLPLFGRLSNAEQQRIFAPSRARKVILATNIAETSITIPGIRFVIDTGLARISRYNANTHTLRLPIETVAQSSANQRAGRAGRMAEGVCIRLYSEKDFQSWPRFATPEILRCNLAAVILRMIAFRIGDVETFPFVEPPQERAIRAGYRLLQDLGALNETRTITPLGTKLARLPCDPTVGRILLQAQQEGCVREALIIAAALSIQDPRERPADKVAEAENMHRKFVHPDSDFLTLLNIWKSYHDETERLSQAKLRKFCKAHFLSYQRMREWRDIHAQLSQILHDVEDDLRENSDDADYHRIHRALLAGLLTHVGTREQGNHYRATHNRQVMLFPGSTLFDRKSAKVERAQNKGQLKPGKSSGKNTPAWILCAEWMETQRLYARTCAGIQPEWILDLGKHICQSSFSEPYYEENSERVLVKETIRLYGLEIAVRRTGYGRIEPQKAAAIFIQCALVDRQLKSPLPFFAHNEAVIRDIEEQQTRTRTLANWSLEERLTAFYTRALDGAWVSSVQELNKLIRQRHRGDDSFLRCSEEILLGNSLDSTLAELYPELVQLADTAVQVAYKYTPGSEDDGATLKVPLAALDKLNPAVLDWAVPGYLAEKVEALLRGLPKDWRKRLFPIGDKASWLLPRLHPGKEPLIAQMSRLLLEEFKVDVPIHIWDQTSIPEHLRMRVEIVDNKDQPLAAGRDLNSVLAQVQAVSRDLSRAGSGDRQKQIWQKARAAHEKHGLLEWNFPDQPESLQLGDLDGVPIHAWPGLRQESDGTVSLRLFETQSAAQKHTPAAFRKLCLRALSKDLTWQLKDLQKALSPALLTATVLMPPQTLRPLADHLYTTHLLHNCACLPLSKKLLEQAITQAKERAKGLGLRLADDLAALFQQAHALHLQSAKHNFIQQQLPLLLDSQLWQRGDWEHIRHITRYLKAMELRAQKLHLDPNRDAERANSLKPFWNAWQKATLPTAARDELFWLLQELQVQTFAQQLGTATKVSPKRIEQFLSNPPAT